MMPSPFSRKVDKGLRVGSYHPLWSSLFSCTCRRLHRTHGISALSPGIPASTIFGLRYRVYALSCQVLAYFFLLEVAIRACPGVMRTGVDASVVAVFVL